MATVRLSVNPGGSIETIVEAAGAATVTSLIELTFDQGASAITDANAPGSARPIQLGEVLIALDLFRAYIAGKSTLASWP